MRQLKKESESSQTKSNRSDIDMPSHTYTFTIQYYDVVIFAFAFQKLLKATTVCLCIALPDYIFFFPTASVLHLVIVSRRIVYHKWGNERTIQLFEKKMKKEVYSMKIQLNFVIFTTPYPLSNHRWSILCWKWQHFTVEIGTTNGTQPIKRYN